MNYHNIFRLRIPLHNTPCVPLYLQLKIVMSTDSRKSVPIQDFFTNLEKQFIGACAFFVTRTENFERLRSKSRDFILDNLEGLTALISWLQDPEVETQAGETRLAGFAVETAKASVQRNLSNKISLRFQKEKLRIRYDGERRQVRE